MSAYYHVTCDYHKNLSVKTEIRNFRIKSICVCTKIIILYRFLFFEIKILWYIHRLCRKEKGRGKKQEERKKPRNSKILSVYSSYKAGLKFFVLSPANKIVRSSRCVSLHCPQSCWDPKAHLIDLLPSFFLLLPSIESKNNTYIYFSNNIDINKNKLLQGN